jgi:hypothetical protein
VIAAHFLRWARSLDGALDPPAPRDSPFEDALEAIGVCVGTASLRLGRRAAWSCVAALTAGGLLSFNTSPPWPEPE